MAELRLLEMPDDERLLRQVSLPVLPTDDIRGLVARMKDIMRNKRGVGLSAIQLGVPKRVAVFNLAEWGHPELTYTVINPRVVRASPRQTRYPEACLSIPSTLGGKGRHKIEVLRPDWLEVRFTDEGGERREVLFADNIVNDLGHGARGHLMGHELAHFDGGLITDHLPREPAAVREPLPLAC